MRKSLLLIACVSVVSFLLGACMSPKLPSQIPAGVAQGNLAYPGLGNARYVIVTHPQTPRMTFLLDSQDGRVWRPVEIPDPNGNVVVWESMKVFQTQKEEMDFLERFGPGRQVQEAPPPPHTTPPNQANQAHPKPGK